MKFLLAVNPGMVEGVRISKNVWSSKILPPNLFKAGVNMLSARPTSIKFNPPFTMRSAVRNTICFIKRRRNSSELVDVTSGNTEEVGSWRRLVKSGMNRINR